MGKGTNLQMFMDCIPNVNQAIVESVADSNQNAKTLVYFPDIALLRLSLLYVSLFIFFYNASLFSLKKENNNITLLQTNADTQEMPQSRSADFLRH